MSYPWRRNQYLNLNIECALTIGLIEVRSDAQKCLTFRGCNSEWPFILYFMAIKSMELFYFFFFLAKINSENIIVLSHMVAHKSETFDHFTSDQIDWQIFFYEFIAKPNKYSHACVQHSKWLN